MRGRGEGSGVIMGRRMTGLEGCEKARMGTAASSALPGSLRFGVTPSRSGRCCCDSAL